ncbi:MAG: LacI family transcriptional regulator [Kiritimatiellae bacterium]|nr:LacI family transcriptional regulator [Kiritimatiellia bacterium]
MTLRDLARELGVTVATVSRALNGLGPRYRISARTVRAVRAAARRLRYVPDPAARALRLRRTQTIGLIVPSLANPFFAEIAAAVESVARAAGYVVLIADSRERTAAEVEAVETLRQRRVDGLLVCPVGRDGAHLVAAAHQGLPVVTADRVAGHPPLPLVAADNVGGGRLAAEHLWAAGHRHVAVIEGLRGTSPTFERWAGFWDAWRRLGRGEAPEPVRLGGAFTVAAGRAAARAVLRHHPEVTAIFAFSCVAAAGALQVLKSRGVKVPEQVSLLAFDDHPYAPLLEPPLSVIAQPVAEIGRRAARLLLDRIAGRAGATAAGGCRLPTRLIVRRSVAERTP